ncbi:NAD(P)-dependent oxidoreductase [Candidatus Woesebacteria bacterium]|nr:NAD(P)-dependent oxidoreductase [Candidatus Woesebacteria bacterium]
MNVFITGATGLVGSRLQEVLKNDFGVVACSSSDLDVTDAKDVEAVVRLADFDVLLHLAAYTNVDKAEQEKEKAFAVNVQGTRNVYSAVTKKGKHMIYVSTDFVFDGTRPPYDEENAPNPIGYYGQTKYEGEKIVKDKAMIVRISYPYLEPSLSFWSGGEGITIPIKPQTPIDIPFPQRGSRMKQDFVQRLRQLLVQGKELRMISNGLMTPTNIDDIGRALIYLVQHFEPTTYHIVGSESVSPYDAAVRIAKKYGLDTNLVKQTTYEAFVKGRAKRPQYAHMVSKKNTFQPMRGFLD